MWASDVFAAKIHAGDTSSAQRASICWHLRMALERGFPAFSREETGQKKVQEDAKVSILLCFESSYRHFEVPIWTLQAHPQASSVL